LYAASKDHGVSDLHSIHVYAIGLKIQGVSAATLRSVMQAVKSSPSSLVSHPTNQVSVNTGYTLIGGGAKVDWTGYGNLLVDSYPSVNFWYVASKDHIWSSPARITAYAIGIQNYIPGFGYIDVFGNDTWYISTGCCLGSGNYYLSYFHPSVTACMGAHSYYNNPNGGRMLTGMRPQYYLDTNVAGSSKDYSTPSGGSLDLYAVWVQKRP
jgi:hypothetical protein